MLLGQPTEKPNGIPSTDGIPVRLAGVAGGIDTGHMLLLPPGTAHAIEELPSTSHDRPSHRRVDEATGPHLPQDGGVHVLCEVCGSVAVAAEPGQVGEHLLDG